MTANKFHAQPTVIDGIKFASKAEARRYQELRLMEQVGVISNLECHPAYALYAPRVKPNPMTGELSQIGWYTPDFRYERDGEVVVEDVKSSPTKTEAYRLRKRMVEATYGIKVTEVE